MAIEVSQMKKADISGGRCAPELGRLSLESAPRGESNGIGLEVSACVTGALCRKTDPKIATAPKTQSRSKDQNKDKDNSK